MQFEENKILSTLRETSKDDHGNSLIDNSEEVYDFDEITKQISNNYRCCKPQHSCDALFIKDQEQIFLIEFKNARKSRVPKKELSLKAYDSIITLQLAFFPHYSLEKIREIVTFVFVYNNNGIVEKESESIAFEQIKNKLSHLTSNESRILFNLEKYKGVLYKDVLTLEKEEFISQFYSSYFMNAM